MIEEIQEQNPRKVAIIALISVTLEAKIERSKEIETEIRKAFEESLARISWIDLENIIVVEQKERQVSSQ